MQGVLGVEGEMTEAQEGTSGGVATSLPRASFPAISRTAVTVPTGRCTGQAAELLCEVTWLPEARRGCATIRRSRATHPVPHGRLADNPGSDRLWTRRGWPCGDALMDALERRGRTRGGRSALDRWIKTRDRVHLQPVLKPGLQHQHLGVRC